MEAPHGGIGVLALPLVLLAAAVISVPIARFGRLSAIVAYLVAGIVIGPFGFGIFGTPERVLTVAELGVVMLLFLIGLELELSRLLAMRRWVFGIGTLQVLLTALIVGMVAVAFGNRIESALVLGMVLAFSSTAVVMQLLVQRNELTSPTGRVVFAVLLLPSSVPLT